MALGLTLGYTTGSQLISFEENNANGSFNGNTVTGVGEFCFSGQPSDGGSLRLGDRRYVFRTSLAGQDCSTGCGVLIGANLSATIQNLINAVNGGPGSATTYLACCTPHATLLAGAGAGSCVLFEQRTNNPPIIVEPPLEDPPVGIFPRDVSVDLIGWWRADQRRITFPGTGALVGFGKCGGDNLGGLPDPERTGCLLSFETEAYPPVFPALVPSDSGFNGRAIVQHSTANTNHLSTPMLDYNFSSIFVLPIHVFWIIRLDGHMNGHILLDTIASPSALQPRELGIHMTTTTNRLAQSPAGANGSVNPVDCPSGQAFLLEAFFTNTSSSFMRVNRGVKSTGSAAGGPFSGGAGSPTARRFIISRQEGEGQSAPISWAEFAMFRGVEVAGQDYTDLTNYFADRYDLTLS